MIHNSANLCFSVGYYKLFIFCILDQSSGIQTQNQIQQMRQVTSSGSTSYSNSQLNNMAETNSSSSSLPFSSDPELSELLEEVMDIMNVSTGKTII